MGSPRLRLLLFALVSVMGFTLVVVPVGPAGSEEAPTESPAAPQEATVDLLGFRASPERLEITTGTTVTWNNKEPVDYPVKSGRHEFKADDGSFASPSMAPGTRWSRRFNLPGEFTYRCAVHAELAGQVIVTGPPILEKLVEEVAITEPKPDDPTSWGFQPNDLIVTTGMTVEWRNNGTNVHTVTSDDQRFESGNIAPGATWKFTFDEPGAFVYHCTPHPWMTASIRVVVPGGTPPPPAPPPAPPEPAVTRAPREAAPTGDQRGPVRHEVDIVEPNPANPNSWIFDPADLDLRTGDTVVWRNTGRMEHSVTGLDGSFDSGLLKPGATWSRTFDSPAFVDYRCTPHPWMRGVLRIGAPTGPPPVPPASRTAAAASVALATPRSPARQGGGPATLNVDIVEPSASDAMSWTFNPKTVEARAGDTVVWRNAGTLEHSVTADTFDAGLLAAGQTFSRTFDTPGVFAYRCTPHPWMKGIVRVADAEGGAVPAIPASLEAGGSGGAGQQAASAAPPAPLHLFAKVTGRGNAVVRLGWALLLSALVVGFSVLLSWAWQGSYPATGATPTH